jgi:hypothetical protein
VSKIVIQASPELEQRMIRLILLLLLLGSTFVPTQAFRTKKLTDHVGEGLRCANIQQRISNTAGVDVAKFNTQGINAVYDRMKLVLGANRISCKLILNPDGSINNLKIQQSSGSKMSDDKTLTMIRNAGPFVSSKLNVPLAYLIELPYLNVETASL